MKEEDKKVLKALAMVTQVGISMLIPVFISALIGWKLDQWFSTGYWFIVFLVIGVLAAFRSLYFLTKQFYSRDLEREKKEQEYFDSMKRERENRQKSQTAEFRGRK